jgi:hypothetical protein
MENKEGDYCDIMKITYEIQYNSTTKTWNVFKYIRSKYSLGFYSIYESDSKKECKEYLDKYLKQLGG